MGKLFKLKEWLTIPEAVKHLTEVLSEAVNESDIYRLALDGHLTLSVNFVNHAKAHRGKLIPMAQAERVQGIPVPPKNEYYEVTLGIPYGDNQIIQFEDMYENSNVVTLNGVFDLAMIGAEKIDIEDKFQMLTGGVAVDLIHLDGTFVVGQDGTVFYSILEELTPVKIESKPFKTIPATYMPANGLPDNSVLVVRTDAINEFLKSINLTQNLTDKLGEQHIRGREVSLLTNKVLLKSDEFVSVVDVCVAIADALYPIPKVGAWPITTRNNLNCQELHREEFKRDLSNGFLSAVFEKNRNIFNYKTDEYCDSLLIRRNAAESYIKSIGMVASTDIVAALFGKIQFESEMLKTNSIETVTPIKAVPRSDQHKSEILNVLAKLGYDPLALPREQKAGARSVAKSKAKEALPRMSRATFDKAWQALRNDEKLKDAT